MSSLLNGCPVFVRYDLTSSGFLVSVSAAACLTVWAETFELLLCDCFCPSFTHSRIAFYVYELCWGITYSIIQIGLCRAAMSDGLPSSPERCYRGSFSVRVFPCAYAHVEYNLLNWFVSVCELSLNWMLTIPPALSSQHPKQTRITNPPLCLQTVMPIRWFHSSKKNLPLKSNKVEGSKSNTGRALRKVWMASENSWR